MNTRSNVMTERANYCATKLKTYFVVWAQDPARPKIDFN